MTTGLAKKPRKTVRPKLADLSLGRDLYGEVCEAQGFVPAGLPAGVQPLPNLRAATAYAEVCEEQGFVPLPTADILRSLTAAGIV